MLTAHVTTPPRLAALRCQMRGRRVYLEITDRRTISFPVSKYDKLAYAPQIELEKIHLHDQGRTIRWETIDEEIQVEDVARNRFVPTARARSVLPAAPARKLLF